MPVTPRTIITPEQFDAIYGALPDANAQLLVETAIESGLRWGELTELRVDRCGQPGGRTEARPAQACSLLSLATICGLSFSRRYSLSWDSA